MSEVIINKLVLSIIRILKPLVRILLRNGISFGTFSDITKWVYVDTAAREFGLNARKQSISRISVLTGLSRKEVKRVKEMTRPTDAGLAEQYNRAVRVVAAWRREKEFCDGQGSPLMLPVTGQGPTFALLVRRFSGDMPFRAVMDELVNAGIVEQTVDNRVRLLNRSYVPADDKGVQFHILGTDVGSLIATIDHNLHAQVPHRLFQRKVSYDNLPREILPVFHATAAESAQKLLENLDVWLADKDRDTNPQAKGTGRYCAGLGIYYFERPFEQEE